MFAIADNILILGYYTNWRDHDKTLKQVMLKGLQENLKLNKSKYHFRGTKIQTSGQVIYKEGQQPKPKKLHVLTEIFLSQQKGNTVVSCKKIPGHILTSRGMWPI